MTQRQDPGRLAWADVCRLIAMFAVLLIHISAPIFYDYRNIELNSFLVANALDSIAGVRHSLTQCERCVLTLMPELSTICSGI